ncbi:MAG: tRNA pseudouridine(13) synthase TruD [Chloroflexota bacterium]
MKLKTVPDDFMVTEILSPDLIGKGGYSLYRVKKTNVTTMAVKSELTRTWQVKGNELHFAGFKDRRAVTTQHMTVKGAGYPSVLEGKGFEAEKIGSATRHIQPRDITSNQFEILVRDLSARKAEIMEQRVMDFGATGFPNYFDAQRFGSYHPDFGFIGQAILKRDARSALRAYMTVPFERDLQPVKRFKAKSMNLWPDWESMMQVAPRPSNYRSVLTYLVDHPEGYRRALNLIPRDLLSLYLSAYQSHLWNQIAAKYLSALPGTTSRGTMTIAGAELPVVKALDPEQARELHSTLIAMPNHRARYDQSSELESAAQQVLVESGFKINDLKARILEKAYLSKDRRSVLCLPQINHVSREKEHGIDKYTSVRLDFTLPRGSYATLMIKLASH